jgi:hypothetical protein
MILASHPDLARQEYAKKLYSFVQAQEGSGEALFAQYLAGALTAEDVRRKLELIKSNRQQWERFQASLPSRIS